MTEAQWLAIRDVPTPGSRGGRAVTLSRRSATLFGVACIQLTPGFQRQRRLMGAMDAAEEAVETGNWRGVARWRTAAEAACKKEKGGSGAYYWAVVTARLTSLKVAKRWPEVALDLLSAAGERTKGLRRAYMGILREVVGNPFRPVTFSPSWRTDTAVALARTMYQSRDFSAMPILADVLEDAGCTDQLILDHLRGPGPHVRGCWALDLILGKS